LQFLSLQRALRFRVSILGSSPVMQAGKRLTNKLTV
jgi:hypothetical protein